MINKVFSNNINCTDLTHGHAGREAAEPLASTLHRNTLDKAEWLGTQLDNDHLVIISICDLLLVNELLYKRILKKEADICEARQRQHQHACLAL